MVTLGLLIFIVIAFIFFRKMIIRLVVLALVAAFAYNAIMSQVQAGVESATSIPGQLMAMVQDKIKGFFGEGKKIMDPLLSAISEGTELYEYCLADKTWVLGNVSPAACQALSGSERTACFEKELAGLESYNGISDLTQLRDLTSNARRLCETSFKVQDAMPTLLGAGARGVGELYGYCKVPGVCIDSDFDNAPYRDCLKEKFETPRPQGLGLTNTYCGVFKTSEDREKWRKCVEVSMIQQTAGEDMALLGFDRTQRGVAAIRACRQLP